MFSSPLTFPPNSPVSFHLLFAVTVRLRRGGGGGNKKPLFETKISKKCSLLIALIEIKFARNLPEPLMTFDLHSQFINAAKMDCAMRVSHIHYYVHQLPKTHIDMLKIIIEHLKK